VKVRDEVRPGDHKDPGPYKHPPGTVAHEYTGQLQEPARAPSQGNAGLSVRRPTGHSGH
jgi:manganese oxidase